MITVKSVRITCCILEKQVKIPASEMGNFYSFMSLPPQRPSLYVVLKNDKPYCL